MSPTIKSLTCHVPSTLAQCRLSEILLPRRQHVYMVVLEKISKTFTTVGREY